MISDNTTAKIVGALFLTAMVTSLFGGGLLESVLGAPEYLINISAYTTRVLLGMVLELINAIAVVGIGIMMFAILKQHSEKIALGYVGFRGALKTFIFLTLVIGWFSLHLISQA